MSANPEFLPGLEEAFEQFLDTRDEPKSDRPELVAVLAPEPAPAMSLGLFGPEILSSAIATFARLEELDEPSRVATINAIRAELHRYSPFAAEPVDCVQWIPVNAVQANDYNPNAVAPPEMKLLERSIEADGYTQPIVAFASEGKYTVVDGFHRNRVGRESAIVRKRIKGYLPLTIINADRADRGDRIASTIRHNRARGKHKVSAMSDIVIELKRRNWSDEKIGRELGMDPDEVLRLTQITGIAEMFANEEFSKAWEIGSVDEATVLSNEPEVEE